MCIHVDNILETTKVVKVKTHLKIEDFMEKSYPEITKRISGSLKTLRKDIADTMQGFSAMAQSATKDGALDKKTKELSALAIGVSTRCDGCIGFHTEALVKLGVTREEFEEVLGMAVYMGGGPSLMYAADAILAFEQFSEVNSAKL
jgi:AhpD family alkylhydroperoxidase